MPLRKKKNLNLEKAQNLSKRKALRNNQSCQLVQLSVLQRFQGLKMLKVPDAIICYSCYHYVLVFAEININFHLYINGVSSLAFFLQCACMNAHMLFAENSSFGPLGLVLIFLLVWNSSEFYCHLIVNPFKWERKNYTYGWT